MKSISRFLTEAITLLLQTPQELFSVGGWTIKKHIEVSSHRITKGGSWMTSKIIQTECPPITNISTLTLVPQYNITMFLQHLQGR